MGLGRARKGCQYPQDAEKFDQCSSVIITLQNQSYQPFRYNYEKDGIHVEGLFSSNPHSFSLEQAIKQLSNP